MRSLLLTWWNRYAFAGDATTNEGRAMLRTRYNALKRQIPFIYAISLVNFVGFHFATSREWQASLWPGCLLIAFMLARLPYWLKREPRELAPEAILARMRPMPFIAATLGRVDKRDSQILLLLIQDCFWRISHGSRGFVGCGVGPDWAAAAA